MFKINKNIILLLTSVSILIFMSSSIYGGQIENQEDLINSLEHANTQEERGKILKDNIITDEIIITLLQKSRDYYNGDEKSASHETSQKLAQIAAETAEFTGNRISIAKVLLYNSRFFKSDREEVIDKAINLFKDSHDRKGEALCYYTMAVCNGEEKMEKALEYIDRAMKIFDDEGEELLKGYSYGMKGYIYYANEEWAKSVENFRKSAEICEEQGDIFHSLDCYEWIQGAYFRAGMFEEGENSLKIQIALIEKLNSGQKRIYPEIDKGYFIDNLAFYPFNKDTWQEMHYTSLANLYNHFNKYEEAIKASETLIELNKNSYKGYRRLGETYAGMGKNEEALKYFLEAVNKSIEPLDICKSYQDLGVFYLHYMKEPDKAIKYFQIALEKTDELSRWKDSYKKSCEKYINEAIKQKN